jgi:hypothetical protein
VGEVPRTSDDQSTRTRGAQPGRCRELTYRMQFAEAYPTPEELSNALNNGTSSRFVHVVHRTWNTLPPSSLLP